MKSNQLKFVNPDYEDIDFEMEGCSKLNKKIAPFAGILQFIGGLLLTPLSFFSNYPEIPVSQWVADGLRNHKERQAWERTSSVPAR